MGTHAKVLLHLLETSEFADSFAQNLAQPPEPWNTHAGVCRGLQLGLRFFFCAYGSGFRLRGSRKGWVLKTMGCLLQSFRELYAVHADCPGIATPCVSICAYERRQIFT